MNVFLFFIVALLTSQCRTHVTYWSGETRGHSLIIFGSLELQPAMIESPLNLSLTHIQLRITGDVEADFHHLCDLINKSVQIIGMIDTNSLDKKSVQSIIRHSDNHASSNAPLSIEARKSLHCYKSQLFSSLSSRLQLPLVILSEQAQCSIFSIDNPYNRLSNFSLLDKPPLITSIMPNEDILAGFIKYTMLSNEENVNGFAIIYDENEDFTKYRLSLESLRTFVIVRRWERTSFLKAQILREIKHLQIFFLDLSESNIKQFFQMMGNHAIEIRYAKIYIFTRGPLNPLLEALLDVESDLNIVRYEVKGLGKEYFKFSLHEQLMSNGFRYLEKAFLQTKFHLKVPKHINCRSEQLHGKDSVGSTFLYREVPTHGQMIHKNLREYIGSEMDYIIKDKFRTILDYNVELIRVRHNSTAKFAVWNMRDGMTYIDDYVVQHTSSVPKTRDKTLIVTTVEDPPFVIYETHRNGRELHGNERWSGFAIQLLEHLSRMNHFDYIIKPVKDGKFGVFNETLGRWDGLIGELLQAQADLALASLTITYDRERMIDFTTPFMSLSLSVIIKKSGQNQGLQFTAPLSPEVWITVLVAYIAVSLILFVVGRVTPREWYPHHPCSSVVKNQFTIQNSFWFTVGSLMQQGCDISPRAASTRIIGTIWWFFILIMVSSYTANLAAFLTIDRMEADIENVEDLSRQTKIKYGTLYGGSTYSFFKDSDIPAYRMMWEAMRANDSVFVNRTEEGIMRVLDGDYALILESTLNEYYSQRNCELTPLGGLLDPRGYGIGLPMGNNRLRDALSESILKLQKDQKLEKMRQYWLQRYNVTLPCYMRNAQTSLPTRNKLTMSKMSSAFIGLGCGLLFGLLVWAAEIGYWMYNLRTAPRQAEQISQHMRRSFCNSRYCFGQRHRRRSLDETLVFYAEKFQSTQPNRTKFLPPVCRMKNGWKNQKVTEL